MGNEIVTCLLRLNLLLYNFLVEKLLIFEFPTATNNFQKMAAAVSHIIDQINSRYGNGIQRITNEDKADIWQMKRNFLYPSYTF
ncbi:DUF4113 domain-containing protein [Colwellia sp. M166]|uniref:DUF4113 domain-containing protein n=1 Tax=Colwellia sp. M166 TaxID=2583805 RepID=UPI00211E16A4|nr:DUF4113 domain-containing protein [Colwellia sp. M166]UUO22390.1 DUF4113 domain-containing protein [Colwellia sp. M166]|tara:strand:- start:189 stop:440 length:252 start_codon:yes stop_codon:yes gene_type:complete